jgi:hypothetical protein
VSVGGSVTVFLAQGQSFSFDGGAVIFLFGDGGATTPALIQGDQYSPIEVPLGTVTALVTGDGVVPTYFPGLQIEPGTSTLALGAVVTVSYLDSLAQTTGITPLTGQPVWVGQALTCLPSEPSINGFTVGLSPPPELLGYYDANLVLSTDLSSAVAGQFVAVGAPYAVTSYVLALGTSTTGLISGTFTPPPGAGDRFAVALIYPNFSQ